MLPAYWLNAGAAEGDSRSLNLSNLDRPAILQVHRPPKIPCFRPLKMATAGKCTSNKITSSTKPAECCRSG